MSVPAQAALDPRWPSRRRSTRTAAFAVVLMLVLAALMEGSRRQPVSPVATADTGGLTVTLDESTWAAPPPAVSTKSVSLSAGGSQAASDHPPREAATRLRQPESTAAMAPVPPLRLVSFNMHSGRGTDGRLALERTAAVLEDCDFAGLFEVRHLPLLGQPKQAQALGERLGLAWQNFPTERWWFQDHFGNAVLHRWPARSQRIPLVNTRGKAYRTAVLTTLDWPPGSTTRVLSVHIDRAADRQPQLATVIELFANLVAPAVLMGDLNTPLEDPLLQELRNQPDVVSPLLRKGVDWPSGAIDWIWTKGLTADRVEIRATDASDHPALFVELLPATAAVTVTAPALR